MTLTTLITLNAALGAAVVYGLLYLLTYAISSDRKEHHELATLPVHESERRAA